MIMPPRSSCFNNRLQDTPRGRISQTRVPVPLLFDEKMSDIYRYFKLILVWNMIVLDERKYNGVHVVGYERGKTLQKKNHLFKKKKPPFQQNVLNNQKTCDGHLPELSTCVCDVHLTRTKCKSMGKGFLILR
jgi:hypothetical protein